MAAATAGSSLSTPFRITTPLPSPPLWASLELQLLQALADGCEEFFEKYLDYSTQAY
jgi:hypothetical protein